MKSEAGRANRDGKLVNVRAPETPWCDVPSPYDQHHVNSLDNTDAILRSIDAVWNGRTIRTAVPLHEIYFRQHGHRLIDQKQWRLPVDRGLVSPTQLIQAKYGVVDFDNATGMREILIDWAKDADRVTAGMLIHGPGGLGKTRLLVEVASKLREDGWMAGFLDRPHEKTGELLKQRFQAVEQLISSCGCKGLLIAVDYAEARQSEVERLARLMFQNAPRDNSYPIRLVLLARGNQWWRDYYQLSDSIEPIFWRHGQPFGNVNEILPLPLGRERVEYFLESVKAFEPYTVEMSKAGILPGWNGIPPSEERLIKISNDNSYARPLAIQMEALLYLTSSSPTNDQNGTSYLLERMLHLEQAHWLKAIGQMNKQRVRAVKRAVAQVTAVQGTTSRAASEELLLADGHYRRKVRADVEVITDDLYCIYQGPDGGLIHLEPDLIGEHLVASVSDSEMIDGCLRWITDKPEADAHGGLRDLLTVLQRASQPEHGAGAARSNAMLDHLIENHIRVLAPAIAEVLTETPGALRERLEGRIDRLDEDELLAIYNELPSHSVTLLDLVARVAAARAERAKKAIALLEPPVFSGDRLIGASIDSWELAHYHLAHCSASLSSYLSALNENNLASEALKDAIDALNIEDYGRSDFLVQARAGTLSRVAGVLSNAGQNNEALSLNREAMDIYMKLSSDHVVDYIWDLQNCLRNMSIILSTLERYEEASVHISAAVSICRDIAPGFPDVFEERLASALSAQGAFLSNCGRYEEALKPKYAAAEIYRKLTSLNPNEFLHPLTEVLVNLSVTLFKLEREEEAIIQLRESVKINRELAQTDPDTFLHPLAISLGKLKEASSRLNCEDEALQTGEHQVNTLRRLAEMRPESFLAELAKSADHLSRLLDRAGQHEAALIVNQESVDAFDRVAVANSSDSQRNLANALSHRGAMLSNAGDSEAAVPINNKAIAIFRKLESTHSDGVVFELAMSLSNAGIMLSRLDRHEEALAAIHEALNVRLALLQEAEPSSCLAELKQDEFVRDINQDYMVLSEILSKIDNDLVKSRISHEGLAAIAPFVENNVSEFQPLITTLYSMYVRACVKSGVDFDEALISRIDDALFAGVKSEDRAIMIETRGKLQALLEQAERTGVLDEIALAELPEHVSSFVCDIFEADKLQKTREA